MSLTLKPYPEYKESGLPWIGKVPAHWDLVRCKYLLRERTEKSGSGAETLLSVSQYTGVTPRRLRNGSEEQDTRSESLVGYKVAATSDLVINTMLAWNGSLGVAAADGIVSPAYAVYRFNSGAVPAYFHFLLRTQLYKGRFKVASTGVVESRLRLYPEDLLRVEAVIPSQEEQQLISEFVASFHHRIDKLIRAKRRVIELLNEQKQAVAHHLLTECAGTRTVSKSGDAWFPLIPRGWSVVPLRRVITSAIDGPHFSPGYEDTGIPFISARNIKVDHWSLEDAKLISEENYKEFSRRVVPEQKDVLYTKGGTTGIARVVDLTFRFQVWVHVAVLKLRHDKVLPQFLALALNSPKCYEQSQLFTRGATNQDLGLNRMKNIVLPLPPTIEEQELVVAEAAHRQGALAIAIEREEKEIALLREYRTRLIADVVTGKLDVRGVELPESDDVEEVSDVEDEEQEDSEELEAVEENVDAD